MQMLQTNGLWGASPFTMSVDSAIEKARKMVPPPHSQYDYGAQQTKETRNSRLEELRESAGLCLSCMWSGDIEATFPCKLDHYKEA